VVVEGVTVTPLQRGATTMLALGLLLNTVGVGVICWLISTLAVYVLPFFVAIHAGFGLTIAARVRLVRQSSLSPPAA
jgi:hypothetical protein